MSQSSLKEKDVYIPEPATIVKNEQVTETENFFEFRLDSGQELGHKPGQFAQVSLAGIGEAPISVSSSPTYKGGFQMVVRRAGNLTGALHAKKPGEKVGFRGPFGTSFPVEDEMKGKDLLFVCGGIGLAPVRSAINYVLDNRNDYGKVTILFGAKQPSERLFTDELAAMHDRSDVALLETVDRPDEEGKWKGNTGVITTLFSEVDFDPQKTLVIVCGPPIMYKFVLIELDKFKLPHDQLYLSLERRMKCGVGKCGHCQVNSIYVCMDGPVLKYSDLYDLREAIR